MNVWVTGDWHLWSTDYNEHHPFRSDRYIGNLSDNYRKHIKDDDIFIHIGDLFDTDVTDVNKASAVIQSIPGYKVLCKGNHDTQDDAYYIQLGFDVVCEVCVIHNIIFSHFPIKVEPDQINIHGHNHSEKMTNLDYNHINTYREDMHLAPIKLDDLIKSATYDTKTESRTDIKVDPSREKPNIYADKKFSTRRTNIADISDMVVGLNEATSTLDEIIFEFPEDVKYWMANDDDATPNYMEESSDAPVDTTATDQYDTADSTTDELFGDRTPYYTTQEPVDGTIRQYSLKAHDKVANESTGKVPVYCISEKDLNAKVLQPRIPDNFLTKNGYEDDTTKRVCFCPTIAKCLTALSQNVKGKTFNVYSPDGDYETYRPSLEQVPDSSITGEVWITEPVKLRLVGRIKCTGPSRGPGMKYKYGDDKHAELYDWSYHELIMNESSSLIDFGNYVNPSKLQDNIYVAYRSDDDRDAYIQMLRTSNSKHAKEALAAELASSDMRLLYVYGNKVVASCEIDVDKPSVDSLFVEPNFRRKGFAEELLNVAISKYSVKEIQVYADNTPAVTLYKKMGFAKVKNLPGGLILMRKPAKPPVILEMVDKIQFGQAMNEAATPGDGKRYPVYIMLMHSSTSLATAIKTVTKSEFSHASISFDSSMKRMYSFGRKFDKNPFIGTFKTEDIHSEFFTSKVIPYALYVVTVTKSELDLMMKRLTFFIKNSTKFVYDKMGLVKNYLGIADEPEYKYFCTRFVADILNAGKPKMIDEPSLVKPDDFKSIDNTSYITGGILSDYNKKDVDKKVQAIINNENLKSAVNESVVDIPHNGPYTKLVLGYQLTAMGESIDADFLDYIKRFKLRFDKDMNVIITRREYEQLRMRYNSALRNIKAAEKDDKLTDVKDELCKLYHILTIIDKFYLSPRAAANDKTEKVRKDITGLRSAILTNFQQHNLFVTTREPGFNFKSYYDVSEYAKQVSPVTITPLSKTVAVTM